MEIGTIQEFVVLAECLNFSEAASRLFISQSSLSKHIKALEQELGTPLFDRTTRSIRLSRAGERYLPYAREIARLCFVAEKELEIFRRPASSCFTIAVMQNPQYYDMAKYITGFRKTHPEVSFNLIEADEFSLYEMFRRKHVNIFPTFDGFKGPEDFIFMPMVKSAIVAIFPKDHPLAREKTVSLRRLGSERLLLPTRGGSLSNQIHGAFFRENISPEIVYEGSSVGCIDLVKNGMGVSLHAVEFASMLQRDGDISCVEISPELSFIYGLGHRPFEELSHDEQLYLSYMREFALEQQLTAEIQTQTPVYE